MLYTRKGDNGTTKTFGCDQRISKSSATAEALGAMDETNSFLGLAKVKTAEKGNAEQAAFIQSIQENLFIIQAEIAGADKHLQPAKVLALETETDRIEKELPPITTFFISGGIELAATFDVARTIARRAERRVVQVHEEGVVKVGDQTLAYLNRLSSILYAWARYANHQAGIKENAPQYK